MPVPLFIRDMCMWPIATRIVGKEPDIVIDLKRGFKIHAYMEDQLGRLAMFYGSSYPYFWEPGTTQLIEKIIPGAKNVIIAGSHIGLTALYARNAMKQEGGAVYTFEPIPHLYDIAKRNFELNPAIGRIVVEKMALGNINGEVIMTNDRIRSRIIERDAVPKSSTETVPVVTIDSYAFKHSIQSIDFLLLDVEGYEYRALKGMEGLLTKTPPKDIIYEISFPGSDDLAAAREIENYLKQFNYSFYLIDDPHDPMLLTHGRTAAAIVLSKATPANYAEYKKRRYFNMYATKRTVEELASLATIIE